MRTAIARPRVFGILAAVLVVAALVAGCGGGGSEDHSVTVGDEQTFTVPSDVHDAYGEMEAFLDQLPYQRWYTQCVIGEIRKSLSPDEAEELESLPESEREAEAMKLLGTAGPECKRATGRPVVDPNASSKEFDLYRAGTTPGIAEFAEANGMSGTQVACVESLYAKLSDEQLTELANGNDKVREGILFPIINPCARLK